MVCATILLVHCVAYRSCHLLATSHAPTIGRKRRYSATERDIGDSASSTTKRKKDDLVKPDTECDSPSEGESIEGDAIPPVEGHDVKEVTKGVKKVDLEDKDKVEDPSSVQPEGVPLPDSPSGLPEPESESPELAQSDVVEEANDEEHADDKDSVASSSPQDSGTTEAQLTPTDTDNTSADETTPAATVKSNLHDTPEIPEFEA